MATQIVSKMHSSGLFFLNVLSYPDYNGDPAFDSYLLLKNDGSNHTLTLVLKVNMAKADMLGLPVKPVVDENRVYYIRPWRDQAWSAWKREFKRQALTWANKFWLIPPANFSRLDVKVGNRTIRPCIYCHFYLDFTGASEAHTTIEVLNLDVAMSQLSTGRGNNDSGLYRSSSAEYDSLDTTSRTNEAPDISGTVYQQANYQTIVHEVGHALGLEHIGVFHGDPLCKLAIAMFDNPVAFDQNSLPVLFKGGSNSKACYGHYASRDRYANVMGGGTIIDIRNAEPWLKRIAFHTVSDVTQWKATMNEADARPQSV